MVNPTPSIITITANNIMAHEAYVAHGSLKIWTLSLLFALIFLDKNLLEWVKTLKDIWNKSSGRRWDLRCAFWIWDCQKFYDFVTWLCHMTSNEIVCYKITQLKTL